jgi:hypothetical protein
MPEKRTPRKRTRAQEHQDAEARRQARKHLQEAIEQRD